MTSNEEIIEEIRKFSPHTERLTLSTLLAVNQKVNVINMSKAGYGKTRNSQELLKMLDIEHKLISGHITPRAFFDILKEDKLTIVDESTILYNTEILNLLLGALWNGIVMWENNHSKESHRFKGNIIFNTNYLPASPYIEALKDRCIFNFIQLTSQQIKDKIESKFSYKPNMETWQEIKNRIFKKTELSELELRTLIYKINYPKSVRDSWKLEIIGKFSKTLVNDLSLVNYFNERNQILEIINSSMKRSEKVKKIAEARMITLRQARKYIPKM